MQYSVRYNGMDRVAEELESVVRERLSLEQLLEESMTHLKQNSGTESVVAGLRACLEDLAEQRKLTLCLARALREAKSIYQRTEDRAAGIQARRVGAVGGSATLRMRPETTVGRVQPVETVALGGTVQTTEITASPDMAEYTAALEEMGVSLGLSD